MEDLKITDPSQITPSSPSEFSHTITKIAIAQICKSIGFKGSKTSALETLTKIATLYLQSLAKSAASRASFSGGRTQCNLYDVVYALEDLSLPAGGFSGAGDVNRTLMSSSTLKELRQFVYAIDELPFARRIPRKETKFESRISNSGKIGVKSSAEVPSWLPEFPDFRSENNNSDRLKKDLKEECWEERRPEYLPVSKIEVEKKKVSGMFVLPLRREKVKFRLRGRRNSKVDMDDLALRSGVCRGGKRVCLIKRVNRFLEDDEQGKVLDNGL